MMKKIFSLFLTFLFLAGITNTVLAQTDDQLIRQQPIYEEQKQELLSSYKTELINYRTLENKQKISVAQYYQVLTLASLEEAVQNTRSLMLSRNLVLKNYVEALRLELIDTHGPKLEDKAFANQYLQSLVTKLDQHSLAVENSQDRLALEQQILFFEQLSQEVEYGIYYAKGLVSFGKLQTVYDQTVSLMELVTARVQERNSGVLLSEKNRALAEIEIKLDQIKLELDEVYTDLVRDEDKFDYGSSAYKSLVKDLDGIYVDLVQNHQYIEEVLR